MTPIFTRGGRRGVSPLLWVTTLVCAVLLLAAATVQACHVHSAPMTVRPGHAMLVAPAEDCPWCAAAQVAMPAAEQDVVELLPRVEMAAPRTTERATPVVWCVTMWSRPPPAGCGAASIGG